MSINVGNIIVPIWLNNVVNVLTYPLQLLRCTAYIQESNIYRVPLRFLSDGENSPLNQFKKLTVSGLMVGFITLSLLSKA